jgi:hypothetical protein
MSEPIFDHDRLDVYRLSIDYVAPSLAIAKNLNGSAATSFVNFNVFTRRPLIPNVRSGSHLRYLLIILCFVTAAGNGVAQDPIVPSKFLPTIRKVQRANLDKIGQLSISAAVRFEWADPKSRDTANVLALWIPSKDKFYATDPFPNEPERSWKKDPIAIPLLFGSSDRSATPGKIFDGYSDETLAERFSITPHASSANSFVVSAYYTAGEGPRLYVDWHLKKENCYYPHYVEYRVGRDKKTAFLTWESKFGYQTIDDTVLPKMVISRTFDPGTGAFVHQKNIIITRIAENSLPEFDNDLTSDSLTEEILFGTEQPALEEPDLTKR